MIRLYRVVRLLLLFSVPLALRLDAIETPRWLNLYILEFDNLRTDPSVAWLSNGFVDMLRQKFGEFDGVRILGRPEMERILQDRAVILRQKTGTGNILVMGSFVRELDQLSVTVQLINIANWEDVGKVQARGSINQIPALGDELFRKTDLVLQDYLPPRQRGVLQPPFARVEIPEYRHQVKELNFSLSTALETLEEAMDVYIGARERGDGMTESHGKFSKEFSFGASDVDEMPIEEVQMLEEILSLVSKNPYQVEIEKPVIEIQDEKENTVLLSIPIKYSLRDNLIKDMLSSLPYTGIREKGSLTTLEFSRKIFPVPAALNDRISKGEFRVVPVIQILDTEGKIRSLILDTSDPYWHRRTSRNVNYMTEHIFSPLIVFTVSGWSLQVTMEAVDIQAKYKIVVPQKEVTRYSKVLIEFVPEIELPQFLSNIL